MKSLFAGICFSVIACTACSKPSLSPMQSYQQAGEYLKQAGSIYSDIGSALSKYDNTDSPNSRRYLSAMGAGLSCSNSRLLLLDFEALVQLQEKPTTEKSEELMRALTGLSKSADRLANSPEINETAPATERLAFREAHTLVLQAEKLVTDLNNR